MRVIERAQRASESVSELWTTKHGLDADRPLAVNPRVKRALADAEPVRRSCVGAALFRYRAEKATCNKWPLFVRPTRSHSGRVWRRCATFGDHAQLAILPRRFASRDAATALSTWRSVGGRPMPEIRKSVGTPSTTARRETISAPTAFRSPDSIKAGYVAATFASAPNSLADRSPARRRVAFSRSPMLVIEYRCSREHLCSQGTICANGRDHLRLQLASP